MDENNRPELKEMDVEWEILMLKHRTADLLGEIEELKAKDRSLIARISRLKAVVRGDEGEEEEEYEEVEAPPPSGQPFDLSKLHQMSAEDIERAFKMRAER